MRPEAVERERAFHRTEIGRLSDAERERLAFHWLRQANDEIERRAEHVEALERLIEGIKKDLRGGRRAPWEQKRAALARIREWEAGE